MFLVVFSWALLVLLTIIFLGFVGVANCSSPRLLVFMVVFFWVLLVPLVIAFLGSISVCCHVLLFLLLFMW